MIAVITVNWNGSDYLPKYLNSLSSQTEKGFKLYFIDNGSTDSSINIIKSYFDKLDIDIIQLDKNYGFAEANNIGIKKALNDGYDYFLTLNNDIEIEKNSIKTIKETIEHYKGSYDVYQLLLVNYYNRRLIDAAGIEFDKYFLARQISYKEDISVLDKLSEEIDGSCAGAAVYSKRAINSIINQYGHFFDASFFAYFEDVDLALRLKKLGLKTMLIKDSIVYHIHSGTGGKNTYLKSYYLSRNMYKYLYKNVKEKLIEYRFRYYFETTKVILMQILKCNIKGAQGTVNGFFDFKKSIK